MIQDESISKKILKKYETAKLINKNQIKAKVKKLFIEKLDHLFDILVCQCPIIHCEKSECNKAHCLGGAHITCSCSREVKIPTMELRFILDQREKVGLKGGQMLIAGPDRKESVRQAENLARKMSKAPVEGGPGPSVELFEVVTEDLNHNEVMDTGDDDDYIELNRKSNDQNRTDLSCFIAEVIRYGVSDRAAAALYNGALKTIY